MELFIKAIDIKCKSLLTAKLETRDLKSVFSIYCTIGNKVIDAEHEFPFFHLKKCDRNWKLRGILLLCKGSRTDVYPSGMSSIGFNADEHVFGEPGGKLVNIFDPEDNVNVIGTVESQERFWKEWLQSIKK